MEAITSSKSAYGSATFRESCFSDWSLGDLGANQDRKVQLSAKHLMIAIRGVNKQHQFSLSFGGEYCDRTTICYKNYEEITRTFQLACRDVPMTFEQLDYDKDTFTNYISIATNTFDKFFHQLSDDDEVSFCLWMCCTLVPYWFSFDSVSRMTSSLLKSSFKVPTKEKCPTFVSQCLEGSSSIMWS